jgi:hypothetical protein
MEIGCKSVVAVLPALQCSIEPVLGLEQTSASVLQELEFLSIMKPSERLGNVRAD